MVRARGFTLIELMIVVVIAAILAAIALPSYRNYVLRTNRTVAKTTLVQVAAQQQQYYTDRKRYASSLTSLGYAANPAYIERDGDIVAASNTETIYQLSIAAFSNSSCTGGGSGSNTRYLLVATPTGNQADDTQCATICLNSVGDRLESGTADAETCWR